MRYSWSVERTLADLLRTQNRSKLARELGHPNRTRVQRWADDSCSPDVSDLPRLAAILRIDLAELTIIVADDTTRRAARGLSAEVA